MNNTKTHFYLILILCLLSSCHVIEKKEMLEDKISASVSTRNLPDTTKQKVDFTSPDWVTSIRPENAELFRHIEYYIPTINISKSDRPALALEESLSDSLGQKVLSSTFYNQETTIDELCKVKAINGLIVLHKGKIVFEQYPDMEAGDRHSIASISKSFIGTVIAHLADQGLLNEQDSITKYIPELRNLGFEKITIEHLLRMASGINCQELLPNMESYTNPKACFYQILEQSGLYPEPENGFPKDIIEVFGDSGIKEDPGITYDYSGVNSVLLSTIAERITNSPYHELVSSIIWSKIGAEQDALISMGSSGVTGSYGTMLVTLRDLARYGLAFTEDANVTIASERYLNQIRTGDSVLFKSKNGLGATQWLKEYAGQGPKFQSYHWDIVFDDGDFLKLGFGGQALYISPDKRLVIACTSAPKTDIMLNYSMRYLIRSLALLDDFK